MARASLRPLVLPVVLSLAALLRPAAAAAREDTVLLLHTNDLHGHIENAPALAGLAKAERAKRKDVLWLDAGDVISGTPVSTVHRGTPVFRVLGAMGVDAACLGNHEFDHGAARIATFREAAPFPLLCANARGVEGELLADAEWTVFDVDGVRVGVIGLLLEDTPARTIRRGNEGVRFEPARAALERLLPKVRAQCDLLVALTHLGYEADVELARAVQGVDVIVGGHTHTDLPGPVRIGSTLVVQAYRYGERLGRLDLRVDLDLRRVTRWEGAPHVVDRRKDPADPATAALVAELEASVESLVGAVVGKASRELDRSDLNTLAEVACREALEADFGLHNERGVRASIPAGPVSVRALWTVFPFDNTLVRVRCRGRALPERFRREAERAGRPVDPAKVYVVATNSFVADHIESHLPGAEPGLEDTGLPFRDAVVEWVRGKGTIP